MEKSLSNLLRITFTTDAILSQYPSLRLKCGNVKTVVASRWSVAKKTSQVTAILSATLASNFPTLENLKVYDLTSRASLFSPSTAIMPVVKGGVWTNIEDEVSCAYYYFCTILGPFRLTTL